MASPPFLARPVGIAQGREGKEKFTAKETSTLTFQQVMQVVRCIFSPVVATALKWRGLGGATI
ncbi:hypothetical protein [Nostoc sp.]|uniref:hypothetical protein n=1 Tax=Nostoc sp. TaxID=1180 RepID=UPI002FFD49A7